jgi:UDP-glucose 4-epimerase
LARVQRSIDDPVPTNEANITGTLNVLLAARDSGVAKVVYASSSSVYGGTPVLPQHEGLVPNPLNPYAVSKMAAEHYCEIFRDIYGLSTASLRYFNVYGPKQDPHSQYATAVVAFLGRVFQDKPPIIHGDGEQSRDLTFIDDVVQANIKAAENGAEGVFNIGSGGNYTINYLAGLVLKLTGKEHLKPVHTEPRIGDPRQTMADVSKAKSFGYEPQFALEEGLKRTIERFKL